ncbi:MAG TPA: universal stress protein [Hanamia sp.]|nr:universal stress protein [Hanamia sp.]
MTTGIKKMTKKEFNFNPSEKILKEKNIQRKKFLAVFDGYKFSKSTLEYAIQLALQSDAYLIGVFLDEFIYRSYSAYNVMNTYKDPLELLKKMDAKDKEKRDEAVMKFEKACAKTGVNHAIHRDKYIAIQELKQESIFADLIIINENETFNRFTEKLPTRFIRDLLTDVQCPVVVVPKAFKPVDKIVLLYDGSPSSVFAIKMFSYLFGDTVDACVEVFTSKDELGSSHLPNNKLMREFIKRHFPKAEYIVNRGEAEVEIPGHLRNHKENELVVLGAYRRSEISRWFKTSMADVLMKELDSPLFIAHNK